MHVKPEVASNRCLGSVGLLRDPGLKGCVQGVKPRSVVVVRGLILRKRGSYSQLAQYLLTGLSEAVGAGVCVGCLPWPSLVERQNQAVLASGHQVVAELQAASFLSGHPRDDQWMLLVEGVSHSLLL